VTCNNNLRITNEDPVAKTLHEIFRVMDNRYMMRNIDLPCAKWNWKEKNKLT